MNNNIHRINDIIKQVPDLRYDCSAGIFETDRRALYDFAELIVAECINCCDEVDRINKAYIEKLQFDPENGPKECIQVIKEHFGVE